MLRCSTELIRYDVAAAEGKIGEVCDFYFDDRDWGVRFIVVDTDGLFGDNRILIRPQDVRELRFPEEAIVLDMARSKVEEASGPAMFPAAAEGATVSDDSLALTEGGQVLRGVAQLSSFEVTGEDAKIGCVHGLLIETTTWSIRYLIVDTGNWLPGKLILLSPHSVERIDWDDRTVAAGVTMEGVKNCPPYDIDSEISREYEAFLHDYYGWKKYWQ